MTKNNIISAVRHHTRVEPNVVSCFVPCGTRYILVFVFYPYQIPNGINRGGRYGTCIKDATEKVCAVRHGIWVEKNMPVYISSRTGRNVLHRSGFYPYRSHNGINYAVGHQIWVEYTQIHIQAVFAVQNRECVIRKTWKNELYKYMTGIIQNHDHKVLAINGMPDHVHILFGMRPTQSLSDLMQDIKGDSSKWINQKGFVQGKFSWQEGYGAFSYSKSHVNTVIDYIKNQEQHHRKKTFLEEFHEFLEKFEVEYDERYVFKPVEYDKE